MGAKTGIMELIVIAQQIVIVMTKEIVWNVKMDFMEKLMAV